MNIFPLIAILLVFTRPALAYIEPGSGGMMVQLVVAGTVGLWVWLRIYWRRFVAWLRPRSASTTVDHSSEGCAGQ